MCAYSQDAYFEALQFGLVFETLIAENLDQNGKRYTSVIEAGK